MASSRRLVSSGFSTCGDFITGNGGGNQPCGLKGYIVDQMPGPLLLAFALGSLARIILFDAKSLWHDEALSLIIAGQPSMGGTWDLARRLQYGSPLYFLGLHAWFAVTGPGEIAARLFSVLGGALALWFALRLVAETSPRGACTYALLMVALLPFSIEYSQEARMYSWLAAFELIASLALWRGLVAPRSSWASAYGIAMALASLTHAGVWIWWGAHALAVTFSPRRTAVGKRFIVATVPSVLLTVAVMAASGELWAKRIEAAFQRPSFHEYLRQTAVLLSSGHHAGWLSGWWLPLAVVAFAAAGFVALWRVNRRREALFLAAQAAVPVLAVYAGICLGLSTKLRYVIAAPVPLIVLVAAGMNACPRVLRAAAVALMLAQQAGSFYGWHLRPPDLEPTFCMLSKKPLRQAVELVTGRWREGDTIVHVSTASLLPFMCMAPRLPKFYLVGNPDFGGALAASPVGAPRPLMEALTGARRLWLVSCPWRFSDPPVVPEELRGTIEHFCSAPALFRLNGMDIYLSDVK